MTLRVDSERLQRERRQRAWTQQHLSEVSGLGIRTIQRIEKSGTASQESVQALASCLELTASELIILPSEQGSLTKRHWPRWPATAVAILAALTFISLASVQYATAKDVTLRLEAVVIAENDRYEHIGEMNIKDGEQSEFRMNGIFRVLIMPKILDGSRVSIALKIYAFVNGQYVLTGEPTLITMHEKEAVFQLGLKQDPASSIRVSVVPVIQPGV